VVCGVNDKSAFAFNMPGTMINSGEIDRAAVVDVLNVRAPYETHDRILSVYVFGIGSLGPVINGILMFLFVSFFIADHNVPFPPTK
jgi:hypothetical protein